MRLYAVCLMLLAGCVGPRPGELENHYKVSAGACFTAGKILLLGRRSVETMQAARELLRVAWLDRRRDRDRLLAYARCAAWVAERQQPSWRESGELLELYRYCKKLGEAEKRADAYLFASILYGLFIETEPATARPKVPEVLRLAHVAAELDSSLYNAWPDRVLGAVFLEAPEIISVGSPDSAEIYFRRALEQAPNYPGNWIGLANTLYQLDEDEEAIEALLTALEVEPGPGWEAEAQEDRAEALRLLKENFDYVPELSEVGSPGPEP